MNTTDKNKSATVFGCGAPLGALTFWGVALWGVIEVIRWVRRH